MLLLALCLGKQRRSGPFVWTMPLSANLVLRNFGLTLFLAQVGLAAGPRCIASAGATGVAFLLYSTALVLLVVTSVWCDRPARPPLRYDLSVHDGAKILFVQIAAALIATQPDPDRASAGGALPGERS